MPHEAITTTAAGLTRNFGLWQDRAMHQPVMVTHHGRPRAVLVSFDAYKGFKAAKAEGNGQRAPSADDDSMVVDGMAQSFVALDHNFRVVRVNRAATAYFGRPARALLGQPLSALYPSLQDEAQTRIFGRVMRTRQWEGFDLPSTLHPGQRIQVNAFPYGDGVGYLFQALSDQDVHQQTVEIETLRALFAAHGAAGMARISLRGMISRIDDSVLAMAGLSREAAISAPLAQLVAPQGRVALDRAVESVLDGKGTTALPLVLTGGRPVTIAIAETRDTYHIDGAAVLVTPRAPDT